MKAYARILYSYTVYTVASCQAIEYNNDL